MQYKSKHYPASKWLSFYAPSKILLSFLTYFFLVVYISMCINYSVILKESIIYQIPSVLPNMLSNYPYPATVQFFIIQNSFFNHKGWYDAKWINVIPSTWKFLCSWFFAHWLVGWFSRCQFNSYKQYKYVISQPY